MSIQQGTPVAVRWIDADIDTDDFKPDDAENHDHVDRWTHGCYVGETDEVLILATDHYVQPEGHFAGRMRIPWGCITEYWRYE